MNSHKTKQKRHVSHNSLFESWLIKAMEDAFTRELKSYHAYKKALSSLRKYPLMLSSGKECRILEGFGPKLCDMLDEKLTRYAEELGVTATEALIQGNNKLSSIGSRSTNCSVSPDTGPTRNHSKNHGIADQLARPTIANPVRTNEKPAPLTCQLRKSWSTPESQKQVFSDVQKQLLTIFSTSKNPMGCSLQELSTCLRISGSIYDTVNVRDSLTELLNSGVVVELADHPGRYTLKADSTVCSDRFVESPSNEEVSRKGSQSSTVSDPIVSHEDRGIVKHQHHSPTSEFNSYPLSFVYANEQCEPTTLRSQAHMKLFVSEDDGSELCGYRVICNHEDLILTGIPYRIDWSATRSLNSESTSSTVVYLLDRKMPEIATGSREPQSVPSSPPLTSSSSGCMSKRPSPFLGSSDPPKPKLQRAISEGSPFQHKLDSALANERSDVIENSNLSPSSKSEDYPLLFVYADENCQPTTLRSQAHVKLFVSEDDGSELCGYRAICNHEDLIVRGIPYRIDWSGTRSLNSESTSSTVVYLLDQKIPEIATGSKKSKDVTPSSPPPAAPPPPLPLMTSSVTCINKRLSPAVDSSNSSRPTFRRSISEGVASASSERFAENLQPMELKASTCHNLGPTHPTYFNRVVSGSTSDASIVPGGTYELVLLADVREQFGLNKVKQLLPPVLQSLGVQCESRALPVGDFLWIIRWHNKAGELKEAVLDYIVERKRADDLAHSITDGRFQEQKYRMKRTQISNTVFLIEECPSMRNQRIPFETMLQAVSNSQIIDGFQVMWSRSPEDTVDWLAALTHHLHDHSSSDVYVSLTSPESEQLSMLRARMWLDFIQLAHKSPPPTVRDMFAKQLLQIHGCSGSKVAAILNTYPTPVSLLRAYDALTTENEKENMLADIKLSETNRTLGKALSRRIYLAYNMV